MTTLKDARGPLRSRSLLLAGSATLLLLAACDSGQSSSPPPVEPAATTGSGSIASAEKADPAPATAAQGARTALEAAPPEDHPDHDPNDGRDHSGHSHAHDHDHGQDQAKKADLLAMAREQLEQAMKAHSQAVQSGAPQSVQEALAEKIALAQDAVVAASGGAMPIATREGSRLVCPVGKERHDFGKLMQGAVAVHDFELRTEGTADLIIHQAKPTCGCTVAHILAEDDQGEMKAYVFGEPIPPGRRVVVPATLQTQGRTGRQNVSITVTSSDPRGSTQLALQAEIEPFLQLQPQALSFGQIEVGEIKTMEATITASRAPVMLEIAPGALTTGLQAELTPIDPDAQGRSVRWKIAVTLGPDLVEGALGRAIQIQSDRPIEGAERDRAGSPATYSIAVQVMARVVGPFTITPQYVSMGLVRPGQAKNFVVRIDCNDSNFDMSQAGLSARVVGVMPPGASDYPAWEYADLFSVSFLPVEGQPNSIDVDVALSGMPEEANGSFRGILIVDIGHASKPEITLPISGVCRGGPTGPAPVSTRPAHQASQEPGSGK